MSVGTRTDLALPSNSEVVDAAGLTLLPGLIDAHFHLDRRPDLPHLFLRHGVTSLRDLGKATTMTDLDGALISAFQEVFGSPLKRVD